MTGSVYVEPGGDVALDRASLSAPAPETLDGLLDQCAEWADEVGWTLVDDAAAAAGVVVGPGVAWEESGAEVVVTERARGVDGFRWAIRHLAFSRQWPFETVPYGLIADHEMDVRRPRRRRAGVAVLLHGGFWMEAWRRDLMEGIAVDLAQQGWETYNLEYGRVGGTGGWPQTGEDVLAGIAAVLKHAEAERVTLIGHSAGAQLALWAAAQRPEVIEAAVSLAGLCDLEQARELRLGGGAVDRFLEDEPIASASPVDQVVGDVPVVLVHCEDDHVVPVDQSERYAEAASTTGGAVSLISVPDGDHMALIEPAGLWPVARNALFAARGSA